MKSKILFLLLFFCQHIHSQDSAFLQLMVDNTYEFDIQDGEFIGPGADFLKKEFENSQYVLIGEYHFSPLIAKFTHAAIQILDEFGFGTMALEIGRHALSDLVDQMDRKNPKDVKQKLRSYYDKYGYYDEEGDLEFTLPFLESEEDAIFFSEALKRDWNIYGLDQEYMHGFVPAIDIMYKKLSESDQEKYASLKKIVQDSLNHYNIKQSNGEENMWLSLKSDSKFYDLLGILKNIEANKEHIDDLIQSINIYSAPNLYAQYYKGFNERLKLKKRQLNKQMIQHDFDLKNDKLLLKYGGLHTAKGSSKWECMDIGNTFAELALLNGNESLHLYFKSRFDRSEGEEYDAASNENSSYYELIRLGKKDKWIAIDLRVARDKSLFYPFAYNLNDDFLKLIINQDILIIPSEEYESTHLK